MNLKNNVFSLSFFAVIQYVKEHSRSVLLLGVLCARSEGLLALARRTYSLYLPPATIRCGFVRFIPNPCRAFGDPRWAFGGGCISNINYHLSTINLPKVVCVAGLDDEAVVGGGVNALSGKVVSRLRRV